MPIKACVGSPGKPDSYEDAMKYPETRRFGDQCSSLCPVPDIATYVNEVGKGLAKVGD